MITITVSFTLVAFMCVRSLQNFENTIYIPYAMMTHLMQTHTGMSLDSSCPLMFKMSLIIPSFLSKPFPLLYPIHILCHFLGPEYGIR